MFESRYLDYYQDIGKGSAAEIKCGLCLFRGGWPRRVLPARRANLPQRIFSIDPRGLLKDGQHHDEKLAPENNERIVRSRTLFGSGSVKLGLKTRWLVLPVALGMIVLVIGAGVRLCGRPSRSPLVIQFLWHTNFNDPRLLPCAVFAVTNSSHHKITCKRAYPQVRHGGIWSTVDLYGPRPIMSDLVQGEGECLIEPIPPGRSESWRLPIVWSRIPATAFEHCLDHFGVVTWFTNYSAELVLTRTEPEVSPNAALPHR